jgi:DNA-3-methyladenine glycosylase I
VEGDDSKVILLIEGVAEGGGRQQFCMSQTNTIIRCPWAGSDPDYIAYHDDEWSVPLHDDIRLFEMLVLEGFQAGLSWITILRKRPAFARAFCQWNVERIARLGKRDVGRLMSDTSIVRNRLKIESAINNARRFLELAGRPGGFDNYIWNFTDGKTLLPKKPYKTWKQVPAATPLSDAMSKELKKRGFTFVGSIICYTYMQTIGMVNDHIEGCFKNPINLVRSGKKAEQED